MSDISIKMESTLETEPKISAPQQPFKYDNFFSPENSTFYANFTYADLATSEKEFRLLRMHPASDNEDVISCELLDKLRLEDMKGKYSTISYCAGNPKNTSRIIVNGHSFKAFANLKHTLQQARQFWDVNFADKERLLWADQICIYTFRQQDSCRRFWRHLPPETAVFIATFH
jgi:hypothetical protein